MFSDNKYVDISVNNEEIASLLPEDIPCLEFAQIMPIATQRIFLNTTFDNNTKSFQFKHFKITFSNRIDLKVKIL